MKFVLSALAILILSGCATTQPSTDDLVHARLGETVTVNGPRVTPLAVVEDSRCPAGVACVWAGRLRVSTRINLGSGGQTREFTLGEPQQIADGSLELVETTPHPMSDRTIEPQDYRFAFRFIGGL